MLLVASLAAFWLAARRQVTWAVVVIGAGLGLTGWQYNPLTPAEQDYATSPFVDDLRTWRERTGAPARLYSRAHMMIAFQPTKSHPLATNTTKRSLDPEVASLQPDLQVLAGASSVGWVGSLASERWLAFTRTSLASDSRLTAGDGKNTLVSNRHLLDGAGVTHLIQTVPFDHEDLLPRHNFKVVDEVASGEGMIRLYENPQVASKAYLTDGSGSATVEQFDRARITVAVQTDQPTTLVLTELASPQWHVAVDGQVRELTPIDTLWRAVGVPAGKHTVTFWYHSPAVTTGLWLAGAGIIMALMLICARFLAPS
jgi:hypothetical protein